MRANFVRGLTVIVVMRFNFISKQRFNKSDNVVATTITSQNSSHDWVFCQKKSLSFQETVAENLTARIQANKFENLQHMKKSITILKAYASIQKMFNTFSVIILF